MSKLMYIHWTFLKTRLSSLISSTRAFNLWKNSVHQSVSDLALIVLINPHAAYSWCFCSILIYVSCSGQYVIRNDGSEDSAFMMGLKRPWCTATKGRSCNYDADGICIMWAFDLSLWLGGVMDGVDGWVWRDEMS